MLYGSSKYLFGDFSNNPAANVTLKAFNADPRKYAKHNFMPNQQDTIISELRAWIYRRAGGGVKWGAAGALQPLPPRLPRDKIFDTYNFHTRLCTDCLRALKKTVFLRNMALLLAAASLGLLDDVSLWVRITLTLIFTGLASKFENLRGLFFAGEFSHQDND